MPRYNRIALNKIVETLEGWIENTENVRYNEQDRDYPNEHRLDELDTRISAMESAVSFLQEIE